jgi:starch phosphorylase
VAFLNLERAREMVLQGEGLGEALKAVARNCVFTTHTPVPAGNESFAVPLVRRYLRPWTEEVGVDAEAALTLGADNGNFNLTVLAIRLSSSTNGVSKLHARVSSDMWRHLWPGSPDQPVMAVTNGVHTESWVGPEMRSLYARHLHPEWETRILDLDMWRKVADIPDSELWASHRSQKERLIRFVRERVRAQTARHGRAPDEMRELETLFDPRALTIGFARRFATYKRAHLALTDLERMRALLGNPERPVQLLFAGKAHPADRAGQEVIRKLFQLTQEEFRGTVVFLEDYDIEVARMMVQGCDVWLNTPRRPQEASGTSGMKSPVNGGINLSVLDGWWPEAFRGDNGWGFGDGEAGGPEDQDREDAAALYRLLEEQVIPTYFEKAEDGLRRAWIGKMKASIESVVPQFSAHRMVRDYVDGIYIPASRRRGE